MDQHRPTLSVVVVVYNIPREAPRTLRSLSATYQRHIAADDYEVIVVDNGSTPPVEAAMVAEFGGNFRLIRMEPAFPSPAAAINRGLSEAKGDVVGVMIDGARIVTPGMLHFARQAASLYPRAVVATLGWYLGSDIQKLAIEGGFDRDREDALLASINWPNDGYRLFEISTPDEASIDGWLTGISESNALFLRREMWDLMGGVDEHFCSPGGGLINPDTLKRAIEVPGSELVLLLGEGSFHQLHGGVATNSPLERFVDALEGWQLEYAQLRGERFRAAAPANPPTYLGTLPRHALSRLVGSAIGPIMRGQQPPLGESFNHELWSLDRIEQPSDPTIAGLVAIAQNAFRDGEFEAAAAVARLTRNHAPDEPEPQRLLAHVGPSLRRRKPDGDRANYHLAVGEAHALLGNAERAAAEFRAALALDQSSPRAHIGLSKLMMPGDGYFTWVARLHEVLVPKFYLEIGVNRGFSLALARPPTCAIGVDPAANLAVRFQTEAHLFAETSDEFFANERLRDLLRGHPLDFAFIDGLHLFEQALMDFIHVEAECGPDSFILFHDTRPIDEATQERVRRTAFYTGDVWKVVPCLKSCRPDLEIFTIATPWSGLTVVTNLDPQSRLLRDDYSSVVEQFTRLSFSDVRDDLDTTLNLVANDWELLAPRFTRPARTAGSD